MTAYADSYSRGLSADGRTNVWVVRCAHPQCRHDFKPTTTMLRHQRFECPKCGQSYAADWNAEGEARVRMLEGSP